MTEELETLNEIIEVCDNCKKFLENNCHHPCCRNNKRIRAGAMKWIKANRVGKDNKEWIEFFNLKEEDLENE